MLDLMELLLWSCNYDVILLKKKLDDSSGLLSIRLLANTGHHQLTLANGRIFTFSNSPMWLFSSAHPSHRRAPGHSHKPHKVPPLVPPRFFLRFIYVLQWGENCFQAEELPTRAPSAGPSQRPRFYWHLFTAAVDGEREFWGRACVPLCLCATDKTSSKKLIWWDSSTRFSTPNVHQDQPPVQTVFNPLLVQDQRDVKRTN